MGLQNTDRFLTSLSDFQSKQEKDNKNRSWISVTIKRGMSHLTCILFDLLVLTLLYSDMGD